MNSDDLGSQVYKTLKERLITCFYKPDSLLNEVQISQELGCSRTPTRQAIIKLEKEGFLEVIPKKGIYVTGITISEIMQVFQTRQIIEPIALRLGWGNIDKTVIRNFKIQFEKTKEVIVDDYFVDAAFHMYIVELCGISFIIRMMHSVFDKNERITVSEKHNQGYENAIPEHLAIIDSILNDDCEKACALLVDHINNCRSLALDSFTSTFDAKQPSFYKNYLENNCFNEE